MRDTPFVLATILYAAAMVLAYLNRDSEKVITTVWVGWAALTASIVTVVIFSAEAPMKKVFSAPLLIHAKTRLPVEGLPYPVLPMGFAIRVRERLTAHPDLLPDITVDSFAQETYHHALQRAIVYWLQQKYPSTWQVDIFPMTLGEMEGYSFQSRDVPSRVYAPGELKTLMAENKFADIGGIFGDTGPFGLAVPEGTKLSVSAPHADPAKGVVSMITLTNGFCSITIEVRGGMSMVGAGSYRMLFGMSQEQAQDAFKADQYIVEISTTFNRFRTGNPEMPKYKKWANDIANGLESQFSDEVVWSKTKDWLLFHRVAGM